MDQSTKREIMACCQDLSNAFAYSLDQKKYEDLASLFTENGTFIRTGVRLEGRESILAAMTQRPTEQFTRHITTNFHCIEINENKAKALVYNISYYGFPESSLPLDFNPRNVMLLDFHDTYTKTNEGWKFEERDARVLLVPEEMRFKLPPQALKTA